jgi:regulatory protein
MDLKVSKERKEELKKACAYALKLLSYRERSKWEVKDRMRKKGYEDNLIEDVLRYLESHNFISDQRFAQVWEENRIKKGYGRKRIYFELRQKGLEVDLIDELLERVYSKVNEVEIALKVVKEKNFLLKKDKPRTRKRIYGFLQRRGFSSEVINEVLTEIEPQISKIDIDG